MFLYFVSIITTLKVEYFRKGKFSKCYAATQLLHTKKYNIEQTKRDPLIKYLFRWKDAKTRLLNRILNQQNSWSCFRSHYFA